MKKYNAYITKIAGFMDVSGKKTISSWQSEKINQFFEGLEFYKKKGYTIAVKSPASLVVFLSPVKVVYPRVRIDPFK